MKVEKKLTQQKKGDDMKNKTTFKTKKKDNFIGFDHLNFSVENFEQSALWYKEVFGFKMVEKGMFETEDKTKQPWGILKNKNSMLALYECPDYKFENKEDEKIHEIAHFGIWLEKKDLWEDTIKEHHLEVYYGSPIKHSYSTSWYIKDPTGYTIEVSVWDNKSIRFRS